MPGTRRALLHRIAVAQQEGRAPSLVAAVVRDGRTVWSGARTSVEGEAPDGEEQYRIGSITKTFTAVLVLRLRDEGLLDLAGPLERHLPGTGVGDVTVVDLLAHRAGLAAETPSPWWERNPGSLRPDLADVLGERPLIHPVGRRFHYSNPGYALLGALVEKLRGAPWADVLRREVLEPLGLRRTTAEPVAPHAGGWAVHPWADVMQPEPLENLGVMAPAGQLWSTTGDLARFAAFLAAGDERVLSAESVREMRTPAAPAEAADVADGYAYGLGMELRHQHGRALVGHTGSLPGFLACLTMSLADDVGAVVLANCTSGPAPFSGAASGRPAHRPPARSPRSSRPSSRPEPRRLQARGQGRPRAHRPPPVRHDGHRTHRRENHLMTTTTAVAPLTTADAEALVTAAVEAAAEKAGVTVSVTVLGAGGHPLAFHRDDRAVLISGGTSTRKAYTALQLNALTADLVDAVQPGGFFHTLPTALDRPLLFIAGGVPVRRDGRLIGAVGVGGGAPELDHGFATAAVASLA
ncbi:CubicO group peptidase, beta-lactamase class C family [Streptomyces sp. di188]|nr:CubicO group peptidase, beta-lactamase class C family [Streptomyces sp. di50b]SCD74745.1 CubicO group peptidase, beta-lactamase class C family [Streptomyces sp. di188]